MIEEKMERQKVERLKFWNDSFAQNNHFWLNGAYFAQKEADKLKSKIKGCEIKIYNFITSTQKQV